MVTIRTVTFVVIINVFLELCFYAECRDGYYGTFCDQKCVDGSYGRQCGKKCQCPIDQCNHETGCKIGICV